MLTLSVQSTIAEGLKQLGAVSPSQFPFIVSLALNKTAQKVKDAEKSAIAKSFQNPTPYTLNSVMIKPSNRQKLYVDILVKDRSANGTPPNKYLKAQIDGGNRAHKRFENALIFSGIMPQGLFATPTDAIKEHIDQYGNIKRSFIVALLGALKNKGGKTTSKRGATAGKQFFAVSGMDGHIKQGIYERVNGREIKMIISFSRQPRYQRLFHFQEVAEQKTKEVLPQEMVNAAEKALRNPRGGNITSEIVNALNYL